MAVLSPGREVSPPSLDSRQLASLLSGETVAVRDRMRVGDRFHLDAGLPFFAKSTTSGGCRVRRMTERELEYALREGAE